MKQYQPFQIEIKSERIGILDPQVFLFDVNTGSWIEVSRPNEKRDMHPIFGNPTFRIVDLVTCQESRYTGEGCKLHALCEYEEKETTSQLVEKQHNLVNQVIRQLTNKVN